MPINQYIPRIDPDTDNINLARVCLTYTMFEDFDQVGRVSVQDIDRRLDENPFRENAIDDWRRCIRRYKASNSRPANVDLLTLVKKLFNPAKANTFIAWLHDLLSFGTELNEPATLTGAFAEANPLHFAAMDGFAEVCTWLIQSGCDVNCNSVAGTPLHCVLLGWSALTGSIQDDFSLDCILGQPERASRIIEELLVAGADPNCCYNARTQSPSPLLIALSSVAHHDVVLVLLDNGATLDDNCLGKLESQSPSEELFEILEHACEANVQPENRGRLLALISRTGKYNTARALHEENGIRFQTSDYEHALRTAAEFGQVDTVKGLLNSHKLDTNAVERRTGLTALHYAAMTDQVEIAKALIDHGADVCKTDIKGRNGLHHSVQGLGTQCLSFFLQLNVDISLASHKGFTALHKAAKGARTAASNILLERLAEGSHVDDIKDNAGKTPLFHASASGSYEAIILLLNAGSNLAGIASDGSTPLHSAAVAGSAEAVRVLLEQGANSRALAQGGASVLHYAINGVNHRHTEAIELLLKSGADPYHPRDEGGTPLECLMKTMTESNTYADRPQGQVQCCLTLLLSMHERPRTSLAEALGSKLAYMACLLESPADHIILLSLIRTGMSAT